MDVERLHVVLQQSFSPDANLRGPAEEMIRNLKHVKGSTSLLLQVAAEKQVRRLTFLSCRTKSQLCPFPD
jgi:importin-7